MLEEVGVDDAILLDKVGVDDAILLEEVGVDDATIGSCLQSVSYTHLTLPTNREV